MASKYVLQTDGSILNLDTTSESKLAAEVAKDIAKENSANSYKTNISGDLKPSVNLNDRGDKTLEKNLLYFQKRIDSFGFESIPPDELTTPVFRNFNSFSDKPNRRIFASELEMAGAHPSLGGKPNDNNEFLDTKFLFFIDYFFEMIVFITVGEIATYLFEELGGDNDVAEDFNLVLGEYTFDRSSPVSSYFLKVLNYPTKLSNINDRVAAFMLGIGVFLSGDENPFGFAKKLLKNSDFWLPGVRKSVLRVISSIVLMTIDGLFASNAKSNQIDLLIRKFEMEKYWHNSILFKHKTSSDGLLDYIGLSQEKAVIEFNYYYYKFAIERMHIGIKYLNYYYLGLSYDVNKESPETRVGLGRIRKGLTSEQKIIDNVPKNIKYTWLGEYSGKEKSTSYRNRALPQAFQLPTSFIGNKTYNKYIKTDGNFKSVFKIDLSLGQNFVINKNNRIPNELVEKLEKELDREYVPFYFHDIRTNEIIAFHAFIDNLTDSYSPNYQETAGFGRIDKVKNYIDTSRTIQLSFLMASTSPEDHDMMWYQINKLVAMCYPQWSKGIEVPNQTDEQGKSDDVRNNLKPPVYPFTQMPTASPLIRLRVGDLIKSNYSRQNLSRLHGIYENNQSLKKAILDTQYHVNTIRRGVRATNFYLLPGVYKVEKDSFFSSKNYVNLLSEVKIDELPEEANNLFGILPNKNHVKVKLVVGDNKSLKKYENYYFIADRNKIIERKNDAEMKDETVGNLPVMKEAILENDNTKYLDGTTDIMNPKVKEDDVVKFNNPFTAAFESAAGKGLAGFITSLNIGGLMDAPWETGRNGSKAPMYVKIDIGFGPIHDIPPGLDHDGMLRAPTYNVGRLMNEMFEGVYDRNTTVHNIDTTQASQTQASSLSAPKIEANSTALSVSDEDTIFDEEVTVVKTLVSSISPFNRE